MSDEADWLCRFQESPIPALLAAGDPALCYQVRRDLLGWPAGPVEELWAQPAAQRLLRKQQADGSWRYPGQSRAAHPEIDYDLLQTWKSLGELADKHLLDGRHPAVPPAAEYILGRQSAEGDVRGILGTQYMPYYHGLLMALLIKVGYGDDPRVERGLDWLLSMRQEDGGWIVPMQAVPAGAKVRAVWSAAPVPPDRSRPFSHLATGMVLTGLVAHPRYRERAEVRHAAALVKSRFFQPDRYYDRQAREYWLKFQFPFWWTTLLTGLDVLSLLGWPAGDVQVERALDWFVASQQPGGLWPTGYEQAGRREPTARERQAQAWVGLVVCRVFKRFFGGPPRADS